MAVTLSIEITENKSKQNIANNTSNVTVKVRASWTGGSWNSLQKPGWLQIDGTTYNFTSSFNADANGNRISTSGSKIIFEQTVNVKHNSDGTKTLITKASYTTGVSSGTIGDTKSINLSTIPRKSSITVSNGTLGAALTIKVNRKSASFTHTIKYTCGSVTGTVLNKKTDLTISWDNKNGNTLDLANQNKTGTSVSVKFTITTYNGSDNIGSESKTISMAIPADCKPSCNISVSDPTGAFTKYKAYVKGVSKLKVVLTDVLSYGSPITSYSTEVNGLTYTSTEFTTNAIKSTTSMTVKATVKDRRGRTGTKSTSINNIIDYAHPKITMKVNRCNSDGTENMQGGYLKVTFSGTVTSLNNINTVKYVLYYKKTTESQYNNSGKGTVMSNTAYSVTNATYIFTADSDSSYNVRMELIDDLNTAFATANASTGFTLMHWRADGTGMSIGKLAELEKAFDVGIKTCIRKDLYVGNKTGYLDGNVGIFAAGQGYMHIQRTINKLEEQWPYIGFLSNNSTKVETRIVYDGECMNFWGGGGFNFNRDITLTNAEKTESLVKVQNSNGSVSLLINNSRGIYDHSTSSWLIYRNSETSKDTFVPSKLSVSGNLEAGTNVSGNESKLGLFGGKSDIFLFSRQSSDTTTVQWGIYDSVGGHMLTYTGNLHIYPRIYTKESIVLPNNMTVSGYDSNGTARIMLKMSDGDTVNLGNTTCVTRLYGKSVYLNGTSTAVTSDERVKKDFVELDRYMDFFKKLNPVGYKYLVGTSDRYHVGFKAGEIKTALEECGLTTQDFAGYVEEDIDKEFYMDTLGYVPFEGKESALRYSEFIALNTYAIQNLLKEVERLKGELSKWTNQSA